MTVAWKSWKDGWRRTTIVTPSYDHRAAGGGIHCAEWWYLVSDGECALELTVYSNRYDDGHRDKDPAWGTDMTLHVPWPTNLASIRTGNTGHECSYVEGGRCWTPFSVCGQARDLFKAHGVDALEQPETFWNALHAKAAEWIAEAKAKRARLEHVLRCPTCMGRGVTGAEGIEED